jgi:hypothetical protein
MTMVESASFGAPYIANGGGKVGAAVSCDAWRVDGGAYP